jgi:hypothetical protein
MALFKCKQTNNTVEFENEWDIVQMRSHPEYEEVTPVVETKEKKTVVKTKAE